MNDSDCMTDLCYRVLHFQIYFWCHNICNLFRSQQNLHTPAAGSGERYERDRSCFICKFNLPHIQESKRMSDEHILNLPCGENTAETDWRAECTEPSSAGEVKCRGEQEEVGWKKSGTLLSLYRRNCIIAAFKSKSCEDLEQDPSLAFPNRETLTLCTWSRSWTASRWFWISKTNSFTSRRKSWWSWKSW